MFPSFLICGPEHSGTTLLSDIFRQTSRYDSGFECGVLLAKTPKEFRSLEPFISNMVRGWKVNLHDLDYICDTDDFSEFYDRLVIRSELKIMTNFFDKTPRYLLRLQDVCQKINAPVFVCFKDPRSIVASDFVRSGQNDFFDLWFDSYVDDKKRYLINLYANYEMARDGKIDKCCLVRLEDICLNSRHTLDRVFNAVDEKFDLRYLNLDGLRYVHTKGKFIAANIPFAYLQLFNHVQVAKIERAFSICDDWFYN